MKLFSALSTLFILGWMATPVEGAPSLKQRVSALETMLSSLMKSSMPKADGVVPERTQVYKTSASCAGIKKTKLYFDGTHPFILLGEQRCGKQTYVTIRWYEKDFSNDIAINTVLKSDVILTPK